MTVVTIQEAKPDHYEQILTLIQKYLDPEGDEIRNRYLFTYKWPSMPDFERKTPGHVILAGSKVVGYMGYIVSRRYINGQFIEWVNGSTAAIEPEYRSYYLKLLTKFADRNTFRTAYSPRENVEKVLTSRAFNFKQFDGIEYLFPTPFFFAFNGGKTITIDFDNFAAIKAASDMERILIEDNCQYIAKAAKITTPEGDFIIIYREFRMCIKILFEPKLTFLEILYVGNKKLLIKYLKNILSQIFYKTRALFMVCPSRFLNDGGYTWAIKKKYKCFCAGEEKFNIDKSKVDDLYSEKTLIDFYSKPKSIYISIDTLLGKKDPLAID